MTENTFQTYSTGPNCNHFFHKLLVTRRVHESRHTLSTIQTLFCLLHKRYSLADLTPQFNLLLSLGKSQVETSLDSLSFRIFQNFLRSSYVLPIQIKQRTNFLTLGISQVSNVLFWLKSWWKHTLSYTVAIATFSSSHYHGLKSLHLLQFKEVMSWDSYTPTTNIIKLLCPLN